LQSVLSLDRTHAEAAARLQFVQQQSARLYKPERPPPPPPKGHAGRWAALGALAAAAVILIVLNINGDNGSNHFVPDPVPDPVPPPYVNGGENEPPAAPQMAGEYELVSYALQGMTLPLSGAMRMVPIGDGRFQFETFVTTSDGATYQYRGVFEGQGANWTTTTLETNDPTAVAGPIPTQVRFDGSTLAMQNSYGQSAVWQKHLNQPQ
jgi:hypothetical protein